MRVLLISHTYMPRINQLKLHELARYPDLRLRVIIPRRWDEPNRFTLRAEVPQNAPFEYCSLPTLFTPHPNRFIFLTPDLTMRAFQPDIVHVEESEQGVALFQALVYKRLWASRARTTFFTWQNVHIILKPRFLSVFERYNLTHSDWGIAGNHAAAQILRQRGFRAPVSIVPQLGVDTQVFQPGDGGRLRHDLEIPPDTFVVGYASRVVPEKGAYLLVEAAAQLSGNWVLLLIGKGPDQERVVRRARELSVYNRLRMIDQVPRTQFTNYLRAMDVLVLPSISTSIWKEQFAGGLLEAMSCGISAVGSSCGEIPNVVGDAGLIFPEGNAQALADCLQALRRDPKLRATLIQRGLERVRQYYTWQHIAGQIHEVWAGLMSGNPPFA